MLRLFARRRGRHAAGVPVPPPRLPSTPVHVPSPRTNGSAPAYGVQLTFADGSSVALPESSPYALAMRTTAGLMLSTEVRARR